MKEKRKKIRHMDTNICIKIDTDLLKRFQSVCEKNNIAYSKVLRKLMEEYAENNDPIIEETTYGENNT